MTEGPIVAADLVGRRAETAGLQQALQAAIGGHGRVVFLAGEAGIGKSRLAEVVAAEAAARGLPTLRGRAVEQTTPGAYRPLAEALSSAVRAGIGPAAADLGPLAATLAGLVPEWRNHDLRTVDDTHVAIAEGVLRFLRATAAGRGALLLLEDLHWADPETLQIVAYLTDNLASEPVLCVVTVRDEPSAGLALVRALERRRAAQVLRLAPLAPSEVMAMVRSCLGASQLADDVVAVADRAEGVPFMVEELLATAISSGALVSERGSWRLAKPAESLVPRTATEAIRDRLGELGDTCRGVIVAAAVLGRRFDWELLPAITDATEGEVLESLHRAVDAQVVRFDGDTQSFRFRHALSRDAVLADLFPAELAALSRRALDAVEAAHPDLHGRWGDLAADLAVRAGEHRRAAALLLESGRRALSEGALASARAALERARGLAPDGQRIEVDEVLLDVVALEGRHDRAGEVAAALLAALGEDPGQASRRAGVHVRLARAAIATTKWEEAHAHLERARLEAAASTDPAVAARVDVLRAQTAIVRQPAEAPVVARAALEAADRLGLPEVACEALEVLGRSQRSHDIDGAEAAFEQALAVADDAGLTVWRARALQELGAIDMLRGRFVDRLEEARELALKVGALPTVAVVDVQVAAALVISDDPEGGAAAAQRSAELGRRHHFDQTVAAAVALEAYRHARRRQRGEVLRCIDEARTLAAGVPDIEVKTSTAAALLALAEEDRAAARRHLCAGLKAAARGGDYSAVPGIGVLALLRQVDGGVDDAPDIAVPSDSAHFLAAALLRYARAVAAGRAGSAAEALALMAEGDGILEHHRWFAHLARRLVAEAALGDGWGDPVAWLQAALGFFAEQGDEPLASACRSLLRKAGAPAPRRRDQTGVPPELRAAGVTARELEVLSLLALGLPNAEIAARLYLSPRTVERHVANLAVKTGTNRRSALVAYAARTLGGNGGTT